MRTKVFLIVAPLVLVLVMLQSFFWVPSYDQQTLGNPERVLDFIEASIGDAKILNPIIHADTASARIVDLVFDGLLNLDENVALRGRLASEWAISEKVYVVVDPAHLFPDGTPVTPAAAKQRFESALEGGALAEHSGLFEGIAVLEPTQRTEQSVGLDANGEQREVSVEVSVPARLVFTLERVYPEFDALVSAVFGEGYIEAQQAQAQRWLRVEGPRIDPASLDASSIIPAIEHNPIIEFKLRDDVRFHDGHLFDAKDVVFTYEAVMNPKNLSPRTSDFEPIKSIDVIDAFTLRVVYKRLFSPAISAWTIGILPEHLLNQDALDVEMDERGLSASARESFGLRDSRFNRNPIGTGPFEFVEWQSDELIHLSRNEAYWGLPALYSNYHYRVVPDPLTQEVEFRSGSIDTYTPQPHQVARYKEDPSYQAYSSLGFGYTYIGYNNRRPLFSDPKVRRALGMAVDIDAIIEFVMYGQGERTTGPYPKNTNWYDHGVDPIPYDPDGARQLLEELGWRENSDGWLEKDGQVFEFNLVTNNGNLLRKAVMTIAQNAWQKIGIKCNTQLFEWAVFLQDFINPGDFDAVILGWSMGVDPDLYQLWHSSQSGQNQLNFVGYDNATADALIERIRKEYDPAEQQRLAHELHQVIAADQPYTFLYAPLTTRVLDQKIVMLDEAGEYTPIRPSKSGDIFYHFNRWKKLDFTPNF